MNPWSKKVTNKIQVYIEGNGRFSTHYLENNLTDATSRPHPQLSGPPKGFGLKDKWPY